MMSSVKFYLAEVIKNDVFKTFSDSESSYIGAVLVRTYDEKRTQDLVCKPMNSRHNDVPLIGEHVLIFQGTNQFSSEDKVRRQWYYLPAYGIQSNINSNELPGISEPRMSDVTDQEDTNPLGVTFSAKPVSQLQHYEGDTIIQGRFSNSIRLGSTVKIPNGAPEEYYSLTPTWDGDVNGDPITIISNAHMDKVNKKFTIESLSPSTGDSSAIYLTSMQRLGTLRLFRTPTKSQSVTSYQGSQLIGSANRIILQAKTDSVILDSPNRITLGAPEIRIGNENAGHPLVKGDTLKMILNDLVQVINSGVIGPAGIASSPIQQGKLIGLLKDIGKLNSTKHYFDK